MIQLRNVSLHFGEQIVFDEINATINKGDRIGLVGRNGTGKSTLLKMLHGEFKPDQGFIDIQKGAKVAYMPQDIVVTSTKPVLEEVLTALPTLYKLFTQKNDLEILINVNPTEDNVNAYAELQHELQELKFEEKKTQAKRLLTGLGFDERKQKLHVHELSVGWRMRIILAKLLLQDADLYLFDEPTNHLDIAAKNWFLQFLQQGNFGYVLVCHDRYFLDKACNITYELSMGHIKAFHGNYSYFVEQKKILSEQLEQAYKKQQQELKQKERFVERFKAKASKAKLAQSMVKKIEKIERIKLDDSVKNISIKLKVPKQSGHIVLKTNDISHIFDEMLFENVAFEIERGDKVALIAPNGTGKTTLFNLIAKKLNLQRGSIDFGHNVSIALFDQDQEKILDPNKTILEEVSSSCAAPEQEIRTILGSLLFSGDDIEKKTKVLSGGERNRVAMSKIILSQANVFLLDEPTNHLDIETKDIILNTLQDYQGTIFFVSHDQDFVNKLATKIIELNNNGTKTYLGNYDAYLEIKKAQEGLHKKDEPFVQKKQQPKDNKVLFELQKKCKNIEHKIEQLEIKKQLLLEKLGTFEYGTPSYFKIEQEYKENDKEILIETNKWEELLFQIDKENI